MTEETKARLESELEVNAYVQSLKYALNNGAKITFQAKRHVDENRDEKFTNQYTVNTLFPDENPVDALKRELLSLSVEDYKLQHLSCRFILQRDHSHRKCFLIGRIRRCFHKHENFEK